MLSPEERLDAFARNLRFRNRHGPKDLNRFTNKELVQKANEFLNSTCWSDADTPEDLVTRLRQRYGKKAGKTRSRNSTKRKRAEARAAQDARQLPLFPHS